MIPTPRSRTRFLVVLVDIFAVLLVIFFVSQEQSFGARIRRIKAGMTQEDAIRIMGCPPGDYRNPNLPKPGQPVFFDLQGTTLEWTNDKHYYWIFLDSEGKVSFAAIDGKIGEPSFWYRLKEWFKINF
jgi:hypothetical protein